MIVAIRVLRKCPLLIKETSAKRHIRNSYRQRALDPPLLFERVMIVMQELYLHTNLLFHIRHYNIFSSIYYMQKLIESMCIANLILWSICIF